MAVIEGVRLVEEALDAGVAFRGAFAVPAFGSSRREAELLRKLANHAVAVQDVEPDQLLEVVDTQSPQGVAAVIEVPRHDLSAIVVEKGAPMLVLDAVQDPGNVGALCRVAWVLGAAGVVLTDGTADAGNPKVLRASMGAMFRFPVVTESAESLLGWMRRREVTMVVADATGAAVRSVTWPERMALVVGNEGAGARREFEEAAHQKVAIPLARGAESLNVAVAAGILLHEAMRVD